MQYSGAEYVDPTLEIMDQFYNTEIRPAMKTDSLRSSHAIARSVLSSKDIKININLLVYQKGASIFRMLHKFIGDKTFFDGVKIYLNRFAYGNADQNDLWDCIRFVCSSLLANKPELQKLVELPSNLNFMVSTLLILTQCKITENPAGQCCAPDNNIFPYHLSVLAQVLGL